MIKSKEVSPLGQGSGQRWQIGDNQHGLQVNNFPMHVLYHLLHEL